MSVPRMFTKVRLHLVKPVCPLIIIKAALFLIALLSAHVARRSFLPFARFNSFAVKLKVLYRVFLLSVVIVVV